MERPTYRHRIVLYRRRQRRHQALRLFRSMGWPAGFVFLLLVMAGGVIGLAH